MSVAFKARAVKPEAPPNNLKKSEKHLIPLQLEPFVTGWRGANHTHTHTHSANLYKSLHTVFSHHAPDFYSIFFFHFFRRVICHPAGAQLGKRTIWKQMIIYLPNSLALYTPQPFLILSISSSPSPPKGIGFGHASVCVCVCVQFSITLLYILYMVHGTQFQLWRGLSIPNACFMPSYILMFLFVLFFHQIKHKPTQRDKTTSRKLPLLLLFLIYLT